MTRDVDRHAPVAEASLPDGSGASGRLGRSAAAPGSTRSAIASRPGPTSRVDPVRRREETWSGVARTWFVRDERAARSTAPRLPPAPPSAPPARPSAPRASVSPPRPEAPPGPTLPGSARSRGCESSTGCHRPRRPQVLAPDHPRPRLPAAGSPHADPPAPARDRHRPRKPHGHPRPASRAAAAAAGGGLRRARPAPGPRWRTGPRVGARRTVRRPRRHRSPGVGPGGGSTHAARSADHDPGHVTLDVALDVALDVGVDVGVDVPRGASRRRAPVRRSRAPVVRRAPGRRPRGERRHGRAGTPSRDGHLRRGRRRPPGADGDARRRPAQLRGTGHRRRRGRHPRRRGRGGRRRDRCPQPLRPGDVRALGRPGRRDVPRSAGPARGRTGGAPRPRDRDVSPGRPR